jgi:hypothetical protein
MTALLYFRRYLGHTAGVVPYLAHTRASPLVAALLVPACSPPGTIGFVDGDAVDGPGSPYMVVIVDTTAVVISAFIDVRLSSWTTRSPAVADNIGSAAGAAACRYEGHGSLLAAVVAMDCLAPCCGNRPMLSFACCRNPPPVAVAG